MKALRRHELKENDLAHALEATKVYLREHGKPLGIAIVGGIVLVTVVSITVRTRAANLEDAWKRKSLLVFGTPEEGRQSLAKLSALTRESGDPSFVLSGLIEQGMQALRLAQNSPVPPDPDFNDQARAALQELLSRFGYNPLAYGTAHLGLATVAENAFAFDRDPAAKETARRHLAAVLDSPPQNTLPFHRMAAERLAALDETFNVVRFAAAPPSPPAPSVEQTTISPTPVPFGQLPPEIRRMHVNSDGSIEEVDTTHEKP